MSPDRAQALYWYAADYHGGQWSRLYRLLSRISRIYRPGALERGPEPGTEAECIYLDLVERKAGQ